MGEIQKEEQKTQMFRYKNASLPTQERVNDLLSHMTLREKVGQLNQRLVWNFVHMKEKAMR